MSNNNLCKENKSNIQNIIEIKDNDKNNDIVKKRSSFKFGKSNLLVKIDRKLSKEFNKTDKITCGGLCYAFLLVFNFFHKLYFLHKYCIFLIVFNHSDIWK